jgi:hypothetical protein
MNITNKPLAAEGFTSYRCKSSYGWIMIGARDNEDAMREALRSCDKAKREDLQIWNGKEYTTIWTTRPYRAQHLKHTDAPKS